MKYLLDEPGLQQLADLIPDCPVLFLIKAAQSLLHQFGVGLDLQGMLDDIPRDARHIRGTPHEYVVVCAEKVDKHVSLFGVETPHRRLEGACTPLGVGLLR
jgi:hypothetical protein